jgi:hypothetical protein
MSEIVPAVTEYHKALAAFIGEFDVLTEVPLPSGEVRRAAAISTGRWIIGGRYVEVHSTYAPEEVFIGERLQIYGYDPDAKIFTVYNFDSASYAATKATGEYDWDTKTFTFDGEQVWPGEERPKFRSVCKVSDSGAIDQRILVKLEGEGFKEVISVTHTPKAK